MNLTTRLNAFHQRVRSNQWLGYFTIFVRILLAYAFIFAGFIKVNGERFTSLSNNHPMGQYLEALFHTGYYYTFIGVVQMLAGLLLLIPRTALFGAMLYFPLILNICILSYAVRFEGSVLTSPLMVLANLYLLGWDYHRLKYVLPFKRSAFKKMLPAKKNRSKKFALKFLSGVFVITATAVGLIVLMNFKVIMPRNTMADCEYQCPESSNETACISFCECIHEQGSSLDDCLEKYGKHFNK